MPAPPAELVLASTSRYRRDLLARFGLPFRCEDPGVDEAEAHHLGLSPLDLARHLAAAKAQAVLARAFVDRSGPEPPRPLVVIGGDQLVALDGAVLGKPGTAAAAADQLARLAGRTHELITALCVASPERSITHTDVARLHLRPLTPAEIDRYIAADHPIDCAGSYKIESLGIALFDSIEATDHTAITGLPLLTLSRLLRTFGFAVP